MHTTVYRGWPDTVQRYRERRMSLEEMWRHVGQSTDQVLTLLAHAQADASFAGVSDEVFIGSVSANRGVVLYLRPVWSALMAAVASQGVLPEFADICRSEIKLLDVGEEAVMEMWEGLA